MRQAVTYKRLKNENSLNFQVQKVVTVAHKRWSFITGCSCKALTGKVLVFWKIGRLWKVVAYERWSPIEIRL